MYGYLETGIQTPMAQGRSTEIISMIRWIRISRLSIKNSLSHPVVLASISFFTAFRSKRYEVPCLSQLLNSCPGNTPKVTFSHLFWDHRAAVEGSFFREREHVDRPHPIPLTSESYTPYPIEPGTFKTLKTRLWPWLSGRRLKVSPLRSEAARITIHNTSPLLVRATAPTALPTKSSIPLSPKPKPKTLGPIRGPIPQTLHTKANQLVYTYLFWDLIYPLLVSR